MKSNKPIISALPRLEPAHIVRTSTGEILTWEAYQEQALHPFLDWVERETERLYNLDPAQVHKDAETLKGNANSYSRSLGYQPAHMELPREVKAKSRLGELVHYKLFSETAAFVRNPNPRKREHKFSRTVNLGAVDSQMARLERDQDQLILSWKCWEDEYTLIFNIPSYLSSRKITKWSLPVVSSGGFIFSTQETPIFKTKQIVAGVDLGRVEPFTMAILSSRGKLAAEYRARPQVRATNRKRERILAEIHHTRTKKHAYDALGIPSDHLTTEISRMRNKASRLGASLKNEVAADIARKTTKHEVSLLRVEDLRWATGKKYGSRWNHGTTINKIEHTNARHGIRTQRVNPRGTSQSCHKCGTTITHNTRTRTVWCGECKTRLDRDVNAALNIALNKSYPNPTNRLIGDTYSSLEQGVGISSPESQNPSCLTC